MAFIQQALDIIVHVLDGTWAVSMTVIPFLCIIFPAAYIHRMDEAPFTSIVEAYRAVTLRYGMYVLAGAVVTGYAAVVFSLSGLLLHVLGTVIVLASAAYGVRSRGVFKITYPDAAGWRAWLPYAWMLVLLGSAAAIVLWHPLLQSLVAVAFYSYVFWRL